MTAVNITTTENKVVVTKVTGSSLVLNVGMRGAAGTIAVGTVSTGAAGSSATVTNTGTSRDAVFDFAIPRGDTGATGPTGPAGSDGVQSDVTGITGAVAVTNIVSISQADYDAISSPDASTIYYITS